MDPTSRPPVLVGVASFDLTPAGGPLWGRLHGMVWVLMNGPTTFVLVAADRARLAGGVLHQVADALGLPPAAVVGWSGGRPRVDVPVDVLVRAARQAVRDAEPGELRLGRSVAWGLRTAPVDSPLLLGQRLRRSHRQLRARAADAPLDALIERLHHRPAPPGLAWGDLLVDLRLATLAVYSESQDLRAVVGWVAGDDPFDAADWPTAGVRGEAARCLAASFAGPGRAPIPVVIVGPSGPGMLTDGSAKPRDADSARRLAERTAVALARQFSRAVEGGEPIDPTTAGVAHAAVTLAGASVRDGAAQLPDAPTSPVDSAGVVQLLRLGSAVWAAVPGAISDGLRLKLEASLAETQPGIQSVYPCPSVGGHTGGFCTPREAHQAPELPPFGPEQGIWLEGTVLELASTIGVHEGSIAPAPDAPPPSAVPLPTEAAPHVVLSFRRGRAGEAAARTIDLHARWRVPTDFVLEPPQNRWQVRLEWERNQEWSAVHVRGVPVDDRHQGMRLRVQTTRSGRLVHLRWSVAEPRRWTGRPFRLVIGPAYGGPLLSSVIRLK